MVFQYCHRLCLWGSLLTLLSWYFCHIVFLSTYHPLPHAHTIIFLFVIFFSTSFLLIHHIVLFYLHITIQITFLCKMTHLCLFIWLLTVTNAHQWAYQDDFYSTHIPSQCIWYQRAAPVYLCFPPVSYSLSDPAKRKPWIVVLANPGVSWPCQYYHRAQSFLCISALSFLVTED